jgi:hypothetical protein
VLEELLDDLRVVVDRRQDAVDDPGDVVQAHLEQRVRLDTLDRQRDAPELGLDADVELEQLEDIRLQRHAGTQVLDLE